MTKRAVLYARVSSDNRDREDRNLLGQLGMCQEYAQKHGYEIVEELAEYDRGASGAGAWKSHGGDVSPRVLDPAYIWDF